MDKDIDVLTDYAYELTETDLLRLFLAEFCPLYYLQDVIKGG